MKPFLLVGIGGGIGAVVRYTLGGIVLHHTVDWKFPLSTFVINVVASVACGVCALWLGIKVM